MATAAPPGARAEARVVTLLPAATEIVAALGAVGSLVGVSHECDYPAAARELPRLTTTSIDPEAAASRIDADASRLRAEGRPVIGVDGDVLRALAPDLIVAQGLCEVCAVVDGEAHRLARLLDPPPAVVSLSAITLAGISLDIRRIGQALGRPAEAEALVLDLERRLARLAPTRPAGEPRRVVCIEWLEPLCLAGHWVPELVAAAGGRDVGARPGDHSTRRDWSEVAHAEARSILAQAEVWLLDGNAYTSRPGPRVVDGAERIHAALEGRELPGLSRWRPAWAA